MKSTWFVEEGSKVLGELEDKVKDGMKKAQGAWCFERTIDLTRCTLE